MPFVLFTGIVLAIAVLKRVLETLRQIVGIAQLAFKLKKLFVR
jgi:hypothetical protein